MQPDLDGFREASITLRAQMGRDVVFLTPTGTTWPGGTILDPETQEPYDPTIAPLASGWASAAVNTLVVGPNGGRVKDDAVNAAIGVVENGEAALIVAANASAIMKDATRVVLFDGTYEITQGPQPDAVAGELPDRLIVRARQRDRETTI